MAADVSSLRRLSAGSGLTLCEAILRSFTGLSREQLYRSFSENGNPTLKTTLAVMKALGLDLTAKIHA